MRPVDDGVDVDSELRVSWPYGKLVVSPPMKSALDTKRTISDIDRALTRASHRVRLLELARSKVLHEATKEKEA